MNKRTKRQTLDRLSRNSWKMEFAMKSVEDQKVMWNSIDQEISPTLEIGTGRIDYREETVVLPWIEVSFNDICRIAEEIYYYKEAMK